MNHPVNSPPKKLHHHLAGLGNGAAHTDNNPYHRQIPPHNIPEREFSTFLRQIDERRNYNPNSPAFVSSTDESSFGVGLSGWQLTVLCLLGIIGVLIVLFLHVISDGAAAYYHYPRKPKRQLRRITSSSRRKKTDSWIEDEYYVKGDSDREEPQSSSIESTRQRSTASGRRIYIHNQRPNLVRTNSSRQQQQQQRAATHGLMGLGEEEEFDVTPSVVLNQGSWIADEEPPPPPPPPPQSPPQTPSYAGLTRRTTTGEPQSPLWTQEASPLAPVIHHPIPVYLKTSSSFASASSSDEKKPPSKVQKLDTPPSSFSSSSSSERVLDPAPPMGLKRRHIAPSQQLTPKPEQQPPPSLTPLSQKSTPSIKNHNDNVITKIPSPNNIPFMPNLETTTPTPKPSTMEELQLSASSLNSTSIIVPGSEDEDDEFSPPPPPQKQANPNAIQHKRNDLKEASDSSVSLQSKIDFDDIDLEEVIGGGGFGQVWKATWHGTPVAVKVLTGSSQKDVPLNILAEFAAEINMLSGMRHPNICLYVGACFEPPNRAIVTELAAHGSLWDALRQHLDSPYVTADGKTNAAWPRYLYPEEVEKVPLVPKGSWPWILVKKVAAGAARGMTYLHKGKPPVLHRDLKSANLLLDESYTTKVADFGLSRLKAQEMSMTGNCGTVQWMAPEVLANQRYAEPADVYSFGIILWELLTRECPYEGMNPIQCALAVLNKGLRPEIPDWCPPPLSALIQACVSHEPETRPTFSQVLSALDAMPCR